MSQRWRPRDSRRDRLCFFRRQGREADGELAALARPFAPGLHRPAVHLHQAFDQRQAQPEAALAPVRRPVPLGEAAVGLAQLVLHALAIGQLAQHLAEAAVQRGHHARSVEPLAGLADVPALVRCPPLARGLLGLPLGGAGGTVLRGEHLVAGPAEHLCFRKPVFLAGGIGVGDRHDAGGQRDVGPGQALRVAAAVVALGVVADDVAGHLQETTALPVGPIGRLRLLRRVGPQRAEPLSRNSSGAIW